MLRIFAIPAALVGATLVVAVTSSPADAAKCYAPKAIAATKTPMSKLPPPGACFVGKIMKIGGVEYCVSCGEKGIEVAPGKCVAACKSGYVWNEQNKRCCAGTAPPPPVIK
jgi:hypothetical protein